MSITSYCGECEQQTVNGVLTHSKACSANNYLVPKPSEYLRPPSIVLKFDSKAEQDAWLEKLKGGSGGILTNTERKTL